MALFVVIMALYYAATLTPAFKLFFAHYLLLSASLANPVLCCLGQASTVSGSVITSARCSIEIARGCDGVEASVIFGAAVLAFPMPWKLRLAGFAVGVAVLQAMNLLRILGLFLVGVYFPRAFQFMHMEAGQVLFILLALALWAGWIHWATRRLQPPSA